MVGDDRTRSKIQHAGAPPADFFRPANRGEGGGSSAPAGRSAPPAPTQFFPIQTPNGEWGRGAERRLAGQGVPAEGKPGHP